MQVTITAIYQELEKVDGMTRVLIQNHPDNEDYDKLARAVREVSTYAFALGNAQEPTG